LNQTSFSPGEIRSLWKWMSPEERHFFHTMVANDKAIWRPLPGPQAIAYWSDADIIGYGGAAGGGKTDLAVGKALTQHRKIAIFRREGTELTAIEDRIREIVGNDKGYNGQKRIWRSPVPGVTQIEFGSVPNLGDETKHQGRPKDLLVIDEAANCLEQQVRFLMGWVRSTVQGQKTQTLLTFNPPTTVEGRWIVKFFAPWLDKDYVGTRAMPGELRYFAMLDGKELEVPTGDVFEHNGELITPQSRTFIAAKVADNPYLYGTGYMTQLQALPEPLRSQMLYGDFEAGMTDDPWQVIPSKWVDIAMARWKARDVKDEMMATGVDVARGGADNTIIARKHKSMWFDEPLVYPGKDTPDGPSVAALVIAASRDRAPCNIDVVGVGSSPYDFLNEAGWQVEPINGASATNEHDKSHLLSFANLKSWLWWHMRELLDPNANNGIALPPHKLLREELCLPKWRLVGRTIHVQTREEMIKELGRSADYASAYINAALPTPKVAHLTAMQRANAGALNGVQRGHDPYAQVQKR
jgi:hypothetical protein